MLLTANARKRPPTACRKKGEREITCSFLEGTLGLTFAYRPSELSQLITHAAVWIASRIPNVGFRAPISFYSLQRHESAKHFGQTVAFSLARDQSGIVHVIVLRVFECACIFLIDDFGIRGVDEFKHHTGD
jgi:hypothetical protein